MFESSKFESCETSQNEISGLHSKDIFKLIVKIKEDQLSTMNFANFKL